MKMLDTLDQQRLHKLLSDTIPLLCKRALGCSLELSVEAFIGVTLCDENASKEVVMVSFKELLLADGSVSSYVWSETPPSPNMDLPPLLVEPVAFSVSEADNCVLTSSSADRFSGNDRRLDRCGEYDPNWRYWSQYSGDTSDSDTPTSLAKHDATNGTTRTSAVTHLPSFPVEMEENVNAVRFGGEPENLKTDTDFDEAQNIGNGFESPYTSIVHNYSLAPSPPLHSSICSPCLSTGSRGLQSELSEGPRKITNRLGSALALSYQHFPMSSSWHKHRTKIKKTSFLALTTAMQPSKSEVGNMHV